MADFTDALDDRLQAFIAEQAIFFVATAPRQGRINLSPKGMDTLRCLGPRRVAYLDFTGSGNETAAHLRDDGRLTLMLCSFGTKPLILRLYGRGSIVRPRDAAWAELGGHFEMQPGVRQIVVLDIESVQTSCGYAVPRYELREERETLTRWADKKGPDGIAEYQRRHNVTSIDGLPTGLLVGEPDDTDETDS